tara:strand:+ start:88 stop:780 length:693 start_codon:yes stop_codon:yes gene_type:complete
MINYSNFNHNSFAKTKDKEDFWGQIRRTVNGKNVSEEQIALLVKSIITNLNLNKKDNVIDLACGNGALSSKVGNFCNKIYGVDNSEYMISVAKEYFESNNILFELSEIITFLKKFPYKTSINKVLCYGSFSFFNENLSNNILRIISEIYPSVKTIFIGNLPDISKHEKFFSKYKPLDLDLKDNNTVIGIWRSKNEFKDLCLSNGWQVSFKNMPKGFYSADYRFDAILSRK